MNKKKLTLLIALSIIILITATSFIIEAVTPQIEANQETVVEDVELPLPSAVEEPVEEEPEVKLLSLNTVAKQVINGDWGSGKEREQKLTEAGYDYEKVQAKVDELVDEPKASKKKTTTKKISKSKAMQIVWNIMRAKGWSEEVCAGILGNMIAESNVNPYAGGDGGTSYGLCQWHNGRKYKMLKFNDKNYNTTDNRPPIEHQIDYLEYELEKGYSYILDSDDTCEEIAYTFCVKFERPSNKHSKGLKRQQLAREVYNTFAV